MTIYHFNDMDAQMRGLCDAVRGELAGALVARGRAVLAVPGGRTPAPFFEMLAGCGDLDWQNIVVLLTDERCVAEDSPRSNGRLLRRVCYKTTRVWRSMCRFMTTRARIHAGVCLEV